MGYDPEGTWDRGSFFKVLGAVAIVATVTALTVATVGAVACAVGASAAMVGTVTTGAAIGGVVSGGLEIGAQILKNGIDDMDLGAVAIETFVGSAYGSISGVAGSTSSSALRLGMRAAKVALGGVSTAMHSINKDGYSFGETVASVCGSIENGMLIQGLFVGVDAYAGKLSDNILKHYKLDGALSFGKKQIAMMVGVLACKNIWRNRSLFI